MKRRILGVLAAVVLAAAGTFMLLAYVNSADDRALAGQETVGVLVVSRPVPRGTPATDLSGEVTTERVPRRVVASDAVDDLEALGDRVTAVNLVPGEQLLASRFVDPQDLESLAQSEVPDGFHQVTVRVSPDRAVGGKLEPGSTVAVLASFTGDAGGETTHIILHKVLVTNVQMEATANVLGSGDEEIPASDLLVTLALDAASVEKVVYAAEHGTLWLSLEPVDAPEVGTQVVTRGVIY